jgi:hypothetical protein
MEGRHIDRGHKHARGAFPHFNAFTCESLKLHDNSSFFTFFTAVSYLCAMHDIAS